MTQSKSKKKSKAVCDSLRNMPKLLAAVEELLQDEAVVFGRVAVSKKSWNKLRAAFHGVTGEFVGLLVSEEEDDLG